MISITFASGPACRAQTDPSSWSDPDMIFTCVLTRHEQSLRRLCAGAQNAHVQQRDPLQASGVSWVHRVVALDEPQ